MILRIFAVLAALLMVAGPAHAEVYKYYDSNGNLVLSDSLPKDSTAAAKAEKVQERPVMTLPALGPDKGRYSAEDEVKKKAEGVKYVVVIQSPAAEATFQRGDEAIPVAYSVTPSLQAGDKLEVLFDGAAADGEISQLSSASLDRGSHTLTVRVLNDKGKELASASSVFYIQQTSKLGPTAPKPAPKPGK
ncbi:MAG TPA: DUF4124 domain-containing protein [Moraxellaceae bacterium]